MVLPCTGSAYRYSVQLLRFVPAAKRFPRTHAGSNDHLGVGAACLATQMDTTRLTYTGPAPYVSALAQELEERGLSLDYEPPFETKDMATALSAVSVLLAATGSVPDLIAGVQAFRERRPGVRIKGLPEASTPSIEQRLARLDELQAEGVISAEECVEQRVRILGEL